MSCAVLGAVCCLFCTAAAPLADCDLSGSIRYVIWTFSWLVHSLIWLPPRLPEPATPMRSVSFAPITLPDAFVPAMVNSGNAALTAAAPRRNLRREREDMLNLSAG